MSFPSAGRDMVRAGAARNMITTMDSRGGAPEMAPSTRRPVMVCLECGRKFYTYAAAERAVRSIHGCPGCGGVDIDLYVG